MTKIELLRKWRNRLINEKHNLHDYDVLSNDFYSTLANVTLIQEFMKDIIEEV